MSQNGKRGGSRPSDPRNKSKDYWKNPTVLKIISSVHMENCTKKAMNIRTLQMKGQKKRKYLPLGTLNKYLSGGKRFGSDKDSTTFGHSTEVKDMIKEKFLIVENAKPNSTKRLCKSKETYKYSVNLDLLTERFIADINDRIANARKRVKDAQIIFNQVRDRPMRFQSEVKQDYPRSKISVSKWAQNRFIKLNKNLSQIRIANLGDAAPLQLFFTFLLGFYYQSGREDKTLLDLFQMAELRISQGKAYTPVTTDKTENLRESVVNLDMRIMMQRKERLDEKSQNPESIFSRLRWALDTVQDIEFAGVFMPIRVD